MNLLARKKESGLLLLAGLMLVWGCKEDLGIELPPDIQRTEVSTIELTLPVSTVYFDSLRTDKQGYLIVGDFSDDIFGSVHAEAYTEFRYKSGSKLETEHLFVRRDDYSDSIADIEFFGARLILDVDRVLTSDNFFQQNIEFHTLLDTIFNEGIYLADRSINTGDLIGSGAVNFSDLSDFDFNSNAYLPVIFDFSEEYSQFLLDEFQNNVSRIRTLGFRIRASSGNGISSFDLLSDTTEIKLLMKGNIYDTATQLIRKDTIFSIASLGLSRVNHFSNIVRDRSGSLIQNAISGEAFEPSTELSYLNQISGVYSVLDLSPFIEFSEGTNGVLINKAILKIPVDPNNDYIPYIRHVNYYLSRQSNPVVVNWPAYFRFPDYLSTILQNEQRYISPAAQPSGIEHEIDTLETAPVQIGFSGTSTLFWQYLYDNTIDDLNNIDVDKRPFVRQYLVNVKHLVMMNSRGISIGRSVIPKDGVKLKLYYTKPRE
jgi:hypothetical protein